MNVLLQRLYMVVTPLLVAVALGAAHRISVLEERVHSLEYSLKFHKEDFDEYRQLAGKELLKIQLRLNTNDEPIGKMNELFETIDNGYLAN